VGLIVGIWYIKCGFSHVGYVCCSLFMKTDDQYVIQGCIVGDGASCLSGAAGALWQL